MNGYHKATRFVTRIVVGSIFAIVFGQWVDEQLHTTPWIMIALLLYVLFGSMYLLIRETTRNG